MIHVLFVCLGNICRSPMAEAVFREMVKKEGLEKKIGIDSAGTGDWHIGHPPHRGTLTILKEKQINADDLIARKISVKDLSEFDYIIGMDTNNVKDIEKLGNIPSHVKVRRLLDFAEQTPENDIPDPYYTGKFPEVYALVKVGCENLLNEFKKELIVKGE